MLDAIRRIIAIPELVQKIIFTLLMILLCRMVAFIPVPGIDMEHTLNMFASLTGGGQNLFQLMDTFSGGAFAKMTITALGIMPYITASIVMQMAIALVPSLQREMKENPDQGKRKVAKWTRIITLFLAMIQSIVVARYVLQLNQMTPGIVLARVVDVQLLGMPILFYAIMVSALTAGTLFLMWLGEQISERGIGNGISLVITVGILSSLPSSIGTIIHHLNLDSQQAGQLNFLSLGLLVAVFIAIIMGTILIIQGQRKIPVQYARRGLVGQDSSVNSSHIPLKINYAGVIPVIFASTFLMFPATIAQFLDKSAWLSSVLNFLMPGTWLYVILYATLIILFTYVWTAMYFRPEQIASDMKKNGAFIPGIRQGKPTQDFLETTMSRITFIGALVLAFIAILPFLVSKILKVDANISHFFGGTTLLILVGVILDTTKQIESHLLMNRYDGFLRKGRLRGR